MKNGLIFYKPMMYIASYGADGNIDTSSVMAIGPSRWDSDGLTLSAQPRTYDDETPAGTFTYLTGVREGHTLSGNLKVANMGELALLDGGTVGTDKKHGQMAWGSNTSCPTLTDRAVVVVDLCDAENTAKMVKIDHCDIAVGTDDMTLGGSDPFVAPFSVYAHPSETAPAILFGYAEAGKVFDPTTWTIGDPKSA